MRSFILIFVIAISNYCFAQTYRISESSKVKEVDISITPGITPEGQRVFQFSFIKVKKFRKDIKIDKVFLITDSGQEIVLTNPVRDTSYQINYHLKAWYSSYVLSEANILTLKEGKISKLKVMIGKRSRDFKVSSTSSNDINSIVASKF